MKTWIGVALAAILCAAGGPALAGQAPRTTGGVTVWTSDVVSDALSATVKELKPITIVGARNGAWSGKLVIESPGPIQGLTVEAGKLAGPGGGIAAANVQVRYAVRWDTSGWLWPNNIDVLHEEAPAVGPVDGRALLPVWVTVKIPADAAAGTYRGEVTVRPAVAAPVHVPLVVDVQDWALPDAQDYRTWMDFVQSPDTLAVEYRTPLWSERHWQLIARTFDLLSPTGARVVYVPLIVRTNLGNEQSMVRWMPTADGGYDYDFSVMDKYLDVAESHLGKPKLVVLQVWDICLSKKSLTRGLWGDSHGGQATREAREELLNKGPRVTAIDPATKQPRVLGLPRYEDAASEALWGPLMDQLRARMGKRGLADRLMLGLMPDLWPNKEEVAFWKKVSGDLPWVIHGHAGARSDLDPGNKLLYKISDIGYAAYVYNMVFNVNPEKGRLYGWQGEGLISNYPRGGGMRGAPVSAREFPGLNITGGQRGLGRISADLWPCVRNQRGQRAGSVYGRYPENNWRNLDITGSLLAPGTFGPVSTARMENLREGLQICEARIFLESALLEAAKKARLGADLAGRCQAALDEHQRAMWKTVWSNDEDLDLVGTVGSGRNPAEGLWQALVKAGRKLPGYWDGAARRKRTDEARKGQEWYVRAWQDREKNLYALAGEVARRLGND